MIDESKIRDWYVSATSEPCKPPRHAPDGAYPAGFWLSAGEVEEAVALMRRAASTPVAPEAKARAERLREAMATVAEPDWAMHGYEVVRDLRVVVRLLADAEIARCDAEVR